MNVSNLFKKSWKTLLINGFIATIIGLLFLFVTDDFLKVLISIIGYILTTLSALLAIIDVHNIANKRPWGVNMFHCIILLVFGLIFVLYPDMISKLTYLVFGIWTAISGIFQLFATLKYNKYIAQSRITIVSAIMLILVGVFLVVYPHFFQVTITKVVGSFLLVTGLWQVFNGFRFKRICKRAEITEIELVDED